MPDVYVPPAPHYCSPWRDGSRTDRAIWRCAVCGRYWWHDDVWNCWVRVRWWHFRLRRCIRTQEAR